MLLLRRLIGVILRRTRQRQGRTLREVARVANVSVPYLSEIERGQKEVSSEVLAALCRALDLRLSDLLDEVLDDLRHLEPEAAPVAPLSTPPDVTVRVPQGLMMECSGGPARSREPRWVLRASRCVPAYTRRPPVSTPARTNRMVLQVAVSEVTGPPGEFWNTGSCHGVRSAHRAR
ncbi:helix-turn-helix domain-containing protein [Protofrankia symbiont of Coriaria ruscifolia]|uniref:Helix-turn-helix domain-containing protein n=1 Tax=Candidatus Protofrankia californiensis TaxID=1839754 RepID=A0A1C3NYW3_9ACTN|nr:helix-turn-helix domain-containing protein [Candidatus Protofrankia californiensis]